MKLEFLWKTMLSLINKKKYNQELTGKIEELRVRIIEDGVLINSLYEDCMSIHGIATKYGNEELLKELNKWDWIFIKHPEWNKRPDLSTCP